MIITRSTTITLEDEEISALQTITQARSQCVYSDCFACDQCPLYLNNHCVGLYASKVLERLKEREKKI